MLTMSKYEQILAEWHLPLMARVVGTRELEVQGLRMGAVKAEAGEDEAELRAFKLSNSLSKGSFHICPVSDEEP